MSKSNKKSFNKNPKYDPYERFSIKDKYEKSSESLQGTFPDEESDKETDKKPEKEIVNDSREETEPKKEVKNESNEDPNELGAKLIKAELMGDEELVKSLKERLEKARQIADAKKAEQPPPSNNSKHEKQEHSQKSSRNKHKKHHHKEKRHHKDQHNEFDTKIACRHYQGPNSDDDEVQSKKHKKDKKEHSRPDSKNHEQTKPKTTETKTVSESCELCFENAQKHLVVSIGKYCYLALPSINSLVEGNCLIIPINHCSSSVTCDEEVWIEIEEFKRALVKMFDKKRSECVFFEQYSEKRKYSHMTIECIPLGLNVSNMAPIYFKKALVESESEWAHNKALIDLKKQNIRKSIPRNMPYFAVNFGLDDGYAHVIENNNLFPDYFAKEVIGGILDLDPLDWRRPKKDEFSVQSQKVIEFVKWWKPYEFNK